MYHEKEKEYDDQCAVLDFNCKESGSRIFVYIKVRVILKQNPSANEIMLFKINRNSSAE